MDVPLPRDVTQQLQRFEEVLARLEGTLKLFLGASVKDLDAQLEPLQRAQLHLALARAAASLFQLHLRASGVDPTDHPAHKEQERLRAVDKRVRKAAAERELADSRPTLAMDVAGVNRFINAALADDLSTQQKAALLARRGKGGAGAGGKRKQREGGAEAEAEEEQSDGAADDGTAAAQAFLAEVAAELPAGGGGAMGGDGSAGAKKKKKKKRKSQEDGPK